MTRFGWAMVGCGFALVCGCNRTSPPAPAAVPGATTGVASTEAVAEPEGDRAEAAGSVDVPDVEATVADEAPAADRGGPMELKLDGIRFAVPANWKKVKPQTNIVEAEFELPRVEGDEHDGRLTLMFSGGDPQEVIANRTAEFIHDSEHSPKVDPVQLGGVQATWVDLRGEWKGPSFRPAETRPDYRMLLVIIPFTGHSSFYAKLTGPRETITAHEDAFREFVESVKITPPGFE